MQVRKTVVYLSPDAQAAARFQHEYAEDLAVLPVGNATQLLRLCEERPDSLDVILHAAPLNSPLGFGLLRTLRQQGVACPVLVLADEQLPPAARGLLREAGVADILPRGIEKAALLNRLYFLHTAGVAPAATPYAFRVDPWKRAFDVTVAAGLLLVLAPLLLLVAALIKLESKGPVLYYSYRVGTGYRVFKFWKFRSMRPDADQLLASMKSQNQYAAADPSAATRIDAATAAELGLCAGCAAAGTRCQSQLIDGQGALICEKFYRQQKKGEGAAAFVKIANDPRITRIGHFIRNTSIDELPQLWNVLMGDMSIVGNRPLPLYEAEKLMSDRDAGRFIAPAGITGLWQVSKRGQGGDMSAEERKALDNEYAQHYSLRKDLEIILRTIPALFQKENV